MIDLSIKYNDKNELDLAIEQNNINKITTIMAEHPDHFVNNNYRNTLPLHNLFINRQYSLVSTYIEKYPLSIAKQNFFKLNLFHIVCRYLNDDNYNLFINMLKIKDVANILNVCDNGNLTPLLEILRLFLNTNNVFYYNAFLLLLENGADINFPLCNAPIFKIIVIPPDEVSISLLKNLQKFNLKLDIYDYIYNPLHDAITKQTTSNNLIIEFLVENGCNINSKNYANLIIRKNLIGLNILFKHLTDISQLIYLDENMNNLIHLALFHNINLDITFKLISLLCNENDYINQKNVDHNTPVHYIVTYYNINHFTEILNKKFINIFVKNKQGIRPIDIVKPDQLSTLLELFVNGYLYTNNISNPNTPCLKYIKKKIFNEKKCLKSIKKTKINFFKEVPNALYDPRTTLIFLYKYCVYKKIKNKLVVPFISHINDILINDKILFDNQFLILPNDKTIFSELYYEFNYFPNYAVQTIIWQDKYTHYVHPLLAFYLTKAIQSKQPFIGFHLEICYKYGNAHSNGLLYNKETFTLERFAPEGSIVTKNIQDLDHFINKTFSKIINNSKFKYIYPQLYFNTNSFQTISKDHNKLDGKQGDPGGYCFAWTMWFFENRINNCNIPLDIFINESIQMINDKKYKSSGNNFTNYIRNYSSELIKMKNNILIQCGINKLNIYNNNYSHEELSKIALVINNLY